jgi:hypothetical protein
VLLVAVVVGAGIVADPASTDHIPGATYKGTHSQGQGSVWIVVSPGGGAVTRFYVDGVRGGICSMASDFYGRAWPITEDPHSFWITVDETEWVRGSFPSPETAEGTLQLGGRGSSCRSPILTWRATVTDEPAPPGFGPSPPPSPQCRVPRVIGLRLPVARDVITRRLCRVGRVRYVRSKHPRGRVIAQRPNAGVLLPGFGRVALKVSRGR